MKNNELLSYLNRICWGELTFDDNKLFELCYIINPESKNALEKVDKKRMSKGSLRYLIKALVVLLYYKYRNIIIVANKINRDHSVVVHHLQDVRNKCLSDRIYDKKLYDYLLEVTKYITIENTQPRTENWKINNIMEITFHNLPKDLIEDIKQFVNNKLYKNDSKSRET